MRFEEKLKNRTAEQIWQEYCGFLDLDMAGYMNIQNRLMSEQFTLWKDSKLGQKLLGDKEIGSIDEFRKTFPLTTYDDYAEILLQKRSDMLPAEPVVWIQTTWEGGMHPIKMAPYSSSMLDTYKRNILACMILGLCSEKGKVNVKPGGTFLYGLAALPYATGLFPRALSDELHVNFLPPVEEAEKLSFSERNKKGFKMGLKSDIDYFFGMGSVAYFVSTSLNKLASGSSGGKKHSISPRIALKY
ncbi:MAG: GH3 auxin-responsive promoter family protein, partial [Bacillota bacterium]|nr:GH3 auxin-responsive promoter family protein [Bacillota bacterium]